MYENILGATVLWYPRANVGPSAVPKVGTVMKIYDEGCVDLVVLEPSGGTSTVRACFPKGSPRLLVDGTTRLTGGAERSGCWELTPFSRAVVGCALRSEAEPEVENAITITNGVLDRMAKARAAKEAKKAADLSSTE